MADGESRSPEAGTKKAPRRFDTSVAHIARVYDYWLGGKDNFAADRHVGEQTIAAYPGIRQAVQAQRVFLGRAVRYLVSSSGGTTILLPTRPGSAPTPRSAASSTAWNSSNLAWSSCHNGGRIRSSRRNTPPRRGRAWHERVNCSPRRPGAHGSPAGPSSTHRPRVR